MNNDELIFVTTINTSSKTLSMYDKKLTIQKQVRYYIEKYKPKYAIMEDTFGYKNILTLKQLQTIHGIIEGILIDNNIEFIKFPPQTIKKTVLGKAGKNAKQELQDYINKTYNINVDNNSTDAIATVLTYIKKI